MPKCVALDDSMLCSVCPQAVAFSCQASLVSWYCSNPKSICPIRMHRMRANSFGMDYSRGLAPHPCAYPERRSAPLRRQTIWPHCIMPNGHLRNRWRSRHWLALNLYPMGSIRSYGIFDSNKRIKQSIECMQKC